MYKNTAAVEMIAVSEVKWTRHDWEFILKDRLDYYNAQFEVTSHNVETTPAPGDRITNERLGHYHVVMKDAGFTTPKARGSMRRALGINVDLASKMSNAQLDHLLDYLRE